MRFKNSDLTIAFGITAVAVCCVRCVCCRWNPASEALLENQDLTKFMVIVAWGVRRNFRYGLEMAIFGELVSRVGALLVDSERCRIARVI